MSQNPDDRVVPRIKNLAVMPAHSFMTVDEALDLCKAEALAGQLEAVLVISVCAETGCLRLRSSSLTRADTLWLLEQAKLDVMEEAWAVDPSQEDGA